jgi:hypothetical protein
MNSAQAWRVAVRNLTKSGFSEAQKLFGDSRELGKYAQD